MELKERDTTDGRRDMQRKQLAKRGRKKKLYDMNLADSKNCKCCEEESIEKHRLYQSKEWSAERSKMPDVVRSCEMKSRSSKVD